MKLKTFKATDKDLAFEVSMFTEERGESIHKRKILPEQVFESYQDVREKFRALLGEEEDNFGYFSFRLKDSDEGTLADVTYKKRHRIFFSEIVIKSIPVYPDRRALEALADALADADDFYIRTEMEQKIEALAIREDLSQRLGNLQDCIEENWIELSQLDGIAQATIPFEGSVSVKEFSLN
jgi:hypothetical protein